MEISKIIKASLPQPKTSRPKAAPAAQVKTSKEAGGSAEGTVQPAFVSDSELQKAAKELEVRFNLKVELVTDEHTGRGVVRIFSEDGERLLRQMPPEQVLEMAAQARQGTLESILDSIV